jgi:hypothetical protein
MMPHGYGVENWMVRFCKKGRLLDIWQSRSPIEISSVIYRSCPTNCGHMGAHSGLIMMMVMVMMVSVMVIIVLEALRQVGWLRQHWPQSFHRLRAF